MKYKIMNQLITEIEQNIKCKIVRYEYLKSGCYSDIFIARNVENKQLLIKVYNDIGFAGKEYKNLTFLSKLNSKFMKPIYYRDDNKCRFMITSYIDGITLNSVSKINSRLNKNIVDVINELHNNKADYFGNVLSKTKYNTWKQYFVDRNQQALENARFLVKEHYIEEKDYRLLIFTLDNIDYFLEENSEPSLLHGDLTPWNIIVNKNETRIEGIIDPFDVCYGDKDYDLFLLEKGRGKEIGLLQNFWKNQNRNLQKKIALYSLWNEVRHYYYSKKKDDYSIKPYFKDMERFL